MISTGMKLVLLAALVFAAFWVYKLRSTHLDTIVRAVNDPGVLAEHVRERAKAEDASPVDTVVVLWGDHGEPETDAGGEVFEPAEATYRDDGAGDFGGEFLDGRSPPVIFSSEQRRREPEPPPIDVHTVTVIDHVVKDGESLSKIAARYFGTGIHWRQLLEYNDIPDPDNLLPGMVIKIRKATDGTSEAPPVAPRETPRPEVARAVTHTVVEDETLADLARRYYEDRRLWKKIFEANRDLLSDPHVLRIGMKLRIP